MNEINPSQLLSQLRANAALAAGGRADHPPAGQQVDFSSMLKDAVGQVNDAQHQAGALQQAFEHGDSNLDLSRVMVASQKAGIEFQLMLNVRNRLISAYQDIMNMQV